MSGTSHTQLQLGGVRIEPAEIEHVIDAQPGVRASVVVAIDVRSFEELMALASTDVVSTALSASADAADPAGALHAALAAAMPADHQLVAHIEGDDTVSVQSIRRAMIEQLPETHVPTRFALHAKLPRSANGTVDRAGCHLLALPADREDAGDSSSETTAVDQPEDVISVQLASAQTHAATAFFALHNIGINGRDWQQVSDLLPRNFDCYALADPHAVLTPMGELSATTTRPFSVERTAALYAAEVVRRQPVGPIVLAGYCMGGMLVMETARQLEQAGRGPLLSVILADWQAPFLESDLGLAGKFALGKQRTGDSNVVRVLNLLRNGTAVAALRRTIERRIAQRAGAMGLPLSQRLQSAGLMQQGLDEIASYVYQPWSRAVLVVRPGDDPRSPPSLEDSGWGDLLESLHVVYVPGLADEMLRAPRVDDVAAAIRDAATDLLANE